MGVTHWRYRKLRVTIRFQPTAFPAQPEARGVPHLTPEGSLFDAHPDGFGSYRVLDEIGAGRFGPVYRAEDTLGVSGTVALKLFHLRLSPEQAGALAHALALLCEAPLDHPTIVGPITAGLAESTPWVAEPYVDGTPLDAILRRNGPQPLADVLLRMTQVAGALDFAAAAGVHHGALHPREILFAGDRTLVTGFGVVQALADAALEVPTSGSVVSPQRAAGLPVSHADDIFALAAITYEVLYGRPLRDRAHLRTLVGPLPGVDHDRLRDVLMGALAEEPDERPATALAFAGGLQGCLDGGTHLHTREVAREDPVADLASDSPLAVIPVHSQAPVPIDDVPVPIDDLPLRADEPTLLRHGGAFEREFEPEPIERHLEPEPAAPSRPVRVTHVVPAAPVAPPRDFEFAARTQERSRVPWFGMAAMLAIGVLMGFAGGFVAGQRDAIPAPRSAERAVSRAEREPEPAATTGQDFTESSVPDSAQRPPSRAEAVRQSVEERPVQPTEPEIEPERVPPAATRAGSTPARQTPPSDPDSVGAATSGPPSLEVVSRPAGAQVFLDGRLVGRTPLVLSGVTPGDHAVRLTMPGHQRWVTSVTVAPGTRARVAASLER